MEEMQNPNAPRKIRKIKRVRPVSEAPVSYGTPSKVNAAPAYTPPPVTPIAPVAPAAPQYGPEYAEELPPQEAGENYYADNGDAESIRFVTEEELQGNQTESISYLIKNKTVIMMLILAAITGMILGTFIFAGKQTAKSRGLDGVVVNSDVPAGRSRCGLVEPHQGCVLYIMNASRQEVTGKTFYATAAEWTKRQRYLIETGNMHYGSVRIKPGYIAQINIPPLQ
jgi:hypothetical protein